MRTGILQSQWALMLVGASVVTATAAADTKDGDRRAFPSERVSTSDRPEPPAAGTALFTHGGEPVGTFYEMTPEARRLGSVAGETDPDVACRADPGSVYCNTLSPKWWQPPGGNPAIVVGDDASLAAVAGCELDRYVLKVNGNVDGLGSGSYTVNAALYTMCPGVGEASLIAGTECQVTLPDESPALIVCEADPATALPTSNVWVSLRFDRLHCGVAVGAPATKGFSADRLDFPGFSCMLDLGGFEPRSLFEDYGTHASFYLEIYTRGACADPNSDPATEAFPNYKGTDHAGLSTTPGAGIRFADDISLSVPECYLSRIEVAVRGNGVTNIDLRTHLDDMDPVNGGVIPDTRFFAIGGPSAAVASKDFDPPILLPQSDLWVGYVTTSAITGPIITGFAPDLGTNEDAISSHDGSHWRTQKLPDRRYAATDVIIHCAGTPPSGPCCDTVLTEHRTCVGGERHGKPCTASYDCPPQGTCIGDAVCRDDLPLMNCATQKLAEMWVSDGVCEGVCVGGDGDGAPCTRQADCPGQTCVVGPNVGRPCQTDFDCLAEDACRRAACAGPFSHSCGVAACCSPDDECRDLTERACYELPPIEIPRARMFVRNRFCDGDAFCPFSACMLRQGDCSFAHDEPGCEDPFCCTDVCDIDPFCCQVTWDWQCVAYAIDECPDPPGNDECTGRGDDGAFPVDVPGNIIVDILNGRERLSDPGFCCHEDDPGARGAGTVWFKFVGPEPADPRDEFSSVRIETCQSNSLNGLDSLLQVFEPADPDRGLCSDGAVCSVAVQDCADGSDCVLDEEVACASLLSIACNDDTPLGCGNRPGNSRVCLPNVVPGQTYYVMVAAKSENYRDVYRLDITQGCTTVPSLPNDFCRDAEQVGNATLAIPFDLSGGADFAEATFDCENPPGILPNMQNDIWYDWVSPVDGEADVTTCDPSLPPASQPNTTMIIYEGCECPALDEQIIDWNDYCGFGCGLSSCCREFDVAKGHCYKLRLGGHAGGTPSGTLTIQARSLADCNENGRVDYYDIDHGTSQDCNNNGTPDECDIKEGTSPDENANGVPDECDECLVDVECDDENVCTADLCDAGICVFSPVPPGTPCSDGIFCNGRETCEGGDCVDGLPPCPGRCSEEYDKCLPREREVTIIRPDRKP